MLVNIELLVTRLDNQVVNVTPISDCYNQVSITLKSEYLTDEDIKKYYSHMNRQDDAKRIENIRQFGKLYDEQEAKDLPITLSRYTITLEEQQIEVK